MTGPLVLLAVSTFKLHNDKSRGADPLLQSTVYDQHIFSSFVLPQNYLACGKDKAGFHALTVLRSWLTSM